MPDSSDPNLIVQSEENGRTIWICKDSKNEKELHLEVWNQDGY